MRKFSTLVVICLSAWVGCAREGSRPFSGQEDLSGQRFGDALLETDVAGDEDSMAPREDTLPSNLDKDVAEEQSPDGATTTPETQDSSSAEPPDQELIGQSDGPAIQCPEGNSVEVQTLLHLQVIPPAGYEAAVYTWKVTQPDGSRFTFQPSHTVPNPTFEANLVGHYVFSCSMNDASGAPIPPPDPFEVDAVASSKIHVELTWHTPLDQDETDTGPNTGSDMDLHFAHPWANQPDTDGDGVNDLWFDNLFDCFWFNASPNWGAFQENIDDDPTLDRDDTDGAGPENLNLTIAESVSYAVGVHYWNDHDFGASEATIRIYFDGELAAVFGPLSLVNNDMWDVCRIDASTEPPTVVPTALDDGTPKVTPDYSNPYFYQ